MGILMLRKKLQRIETKVKYNQEELLKSQINKTEYNRHLKNIIELYKELLDTEQELKRLKTDTNIYKRLGNILIEQDLEDAKLSIARKLEIYKKKKDETRKNLKTETTKAQDLYKKQQQLAKERLKILERIQREINK